ncbi:MAG: thioredoxin fold domain-containing protein [Pseudomonadota bacterium]|nr:MAG: thioredoxin fold domain-containing protein [Pseudomonadota bacterium]
MLCLCLVSGVPAQAADSATADPNLTDDRRLSEPLTLPNWFKNSFLEMEDDLDAAVKAGKRGLIIYFHRDDCPYCKAHLEHNWGRKDIAAYTRKHFDVITINVRGDRDVLDFDQTVSTEKEFALRHHANFTPSLIFYDANGRVALRLVGYRPPYQFRAALEYVADGHYRKENFRAYLARGERATSFGQDTLNEHDAFGRPPYILDRSRITGQRPLVVFFEERRCHPCDVLHGGPLSDDGTTGKLLALDAVQLDMWSNTPVVTPDGRRMNAKQWADRMGLSYAPTLIFYDERGAEIIRVDSVVGFFRLNRVLDYVVSGGYRQEPSFIKWREQQRAERERKNKPPHIPAFTED